MTSLFMDVFPKEIVNRALFVQFVLLSWHRRWLRRRGILRANGLVACGFLNLDREIAAIAVEIVNGDVLHTTIGKLDPQGVGAGRGGGPDHALVFKGLDDREEVRLFSNETFG